MVSAEHYETVGTNLRHRILVEQTAQNQAGNSSTVRVRGFLCNESDYRVWNLYNDIPRSISGTASYNPGPFGFDTPPHTTFGYIGNYFTVVHDAEGYKTVNFTVYYGDTDVGFGNDKYCSVSLALTRIPKRPSPPGTPSFSNQTPTTVTVSWAASSDNNGSAIVSYTLRRWTGGSQSGTYVDSVANNLSRNVTGLIPGTTYTFGVYAKNSSADNGGYSNISGDNHIQMIGSAWTRYGGTWKRAVPYVRTGGVWRVAIPYVRSDGAWKTTN